MRNFHCMLLQKQGNLPRYLPRHCYFVVSNILFSYYSQLNRFQFNLRNLPLWIKWKRIMISLYLVEMGFSFENNNFKASSLQNEILLVNWNKIYAYLTQSFAFLETCFFWLFSKENVFIFHIYLSSHVQELWLILDILL